MLLGQGICVRAMRVTISNLSFMPSEIALGSAGGKRDRRQPIYLGSKATKQARVGKTQRRIVLK
jgi:hypothetical protein